LICIRAASLLKDQRLLALVVLGILTAAHKQLELTLFSPISYFNGLIPEHGIANERGFYYSTLGLRPTLEHRSWFRHPWLHDGLAVQGETGLYTRGTVGMAPFAAGADVRWIDPFALVDPFLARLPARSGARVGHYERAFPPGYLESEISGQNRLRDAKLRALYDDVVVVTRGRLFSTVRFVALWRLNSGYHQIDSQSFSKESIGLPGVRGDSRDPSSCFGIYRGCGNTWKLDQADDLSVKVYKIVVTP
jgi:arabinofuranosyltransferase